MKYGQSEVEIVGVARDAKYADLRSPVPPTVYLAALQWPAATVRYLVRTAGDPEAAFPAIRAMLREIDPTLPVLGLRTMDEQIDRLHQQELLFARLSGFFGVLALLLASVGLYGLMAYVVTRRVGEIGVRMALGALPRQIVGLFLSESGAMVVIGLVFGGYAAWAASSLFTKMLFGLTGTDPVVYIGAAILLLGMAQCAAALPAFRASRVSPSEALRNE
jgi:ABC-type antimicrobial peptide transport system permease subunit